MFNRIERIDLAKRALGGEFSLTGTGHTGPSPEYLFAHLPEFNRKEDFPEYRALSNALITCQLASQRPPVHLPPFMIRGATHMVTGETGRSRVIRLKRTGTGSQWRNTGIGYAEATAYAEEQWPDSLQELPHCSYAFKLQLWDPFDLQRVNLSEQADLAALRRTLYFVTRYSTRSILAEPSNTRAFRNQTDRYALCFTDDDLLGMELIGGLPSQQGHMLWTCCARCGVALVERQTTEGNLKAAGCPRCQGSFRYGHKRWEDAIYGAPQPPDYVPGVVTAPIPKVAVEFLSDKGYTFPDLAKRWPCDSA